MTYMEQAAAVGQSADAQVANLSAQISSLTAQGAADQKTISDLKAQIAALTPPTPTPTPTPTPAGAKFPGDDGKGLRYGLSSTADVPSQVFRSYNNNIANAQADKAAGRTPMTSVKVPDGSWKNFAAGTHDAWFLGIAKGLDALGIGVMLAVHHEPWGDPNGTPAEWVAMQKHARKLLDANTKNVALYSIMNGWPIMQKDPGNAAYKHGPADGPHLGGFDSYNTFAPGVKPTWREPAEVFNSSIDLLESWGYKGLIVIGEYGCRVDPTKPGRAEQWMKDAYALFKSRDVQAAAYFNSGLNSPDGTWVMSTPVEQTYRALLASNKR